MKRGGFKEERLFLRRYMSKKKDGPYQLVERIDQQGEGGSLNARVRKDLRCN